MIRQEHGGLNPSVIIDGAYFLDRDPDLFAEVMALYRLDEAYAFPKDPVTVQRLRIELDFFLLKDQASGIEEMIRQNTESIVKEAIRNALGATCDSCRKSILVETM